MQRSCCVVTWGGVGSRTVYDFVLNHSDVSRALSHSFRWLAACQLEFCISLRCWTIKRLSLTSVKQKCRREGIIIQPKVAFISSASYTTAERSEGWDLRPVLSLKTLRVQQVHSPRLVLPFPARSMTWEEAPQQIFNAEDAPNCFRCHFKNNVSDICIK